MRVPKRPASLRVARVSGRSRTRALSCRSASAPAPQTNANPTSTYARSRRPNTLEGHAETGVADDASIDSARLPMAAVSTFQVCRLCTNPLPHEYEVPLLTVADTGQNPIAAATTITSPAMRSTTCCGPDNWRTTLPGAPPDPNPAGLTTVTLRPQCATVEDPAGESRVARRMHSRGQPSTKRRSSQRVAQCHHRFGGRFLGRVEDAVEPVEPVDHAVVARRRDRDAGRT